MTLNLTKTFAAMAVAISTVSLPAKVDAAANRVPTEMSSTIYRPMEAFQHVLGDQSYMGYFQPKNSACSVWIMAEPANAAATNHPDQQQIVVDLPANQSLGFIVNSYGAKLNVQCRADAQAVIVTQTWVPAGSYPMQVGQNH